MPKKKQTPATIFDLSTQLATKLAARVPGDFEAFLREKVAGEARPVADAAQQTEAARERRESYQALAAFLEQNPTLDATTCGRALGLAKSPELKKVLARYRQFLTSPTDLRDAISCDGKVS